MARRDEDHIKAHVEHLQRRPCRHIKFRRAGQPRLLMHTQGFRRRVQSATRLHLDKNKNVSPPCDEINLTGTGFHAPPDDPVKAQPEPQGRQRFSPQATRIIRATRAGFFCLGSRGALIAALADRQCTGIDVAALQPRHGDDFGHRILEA